MVIRVSGQSAVPQVGNVKMGSWLADADGRRRQWPLTPSQEPHILLQASVPSPLTDESLSWKHLTIFQHHICHSLAVSFVPIVPQRCVHVELGVRILLLHCLGTSRCPCIRSAARMSIYHRVVNV